MDLDLLKQWNFDPSIVGGIVALALLYPAWLRQAVSLAPCRSPSTERAAALPSTSRWRIASYYGGLSILALALASPLDALSDRYLFTAHMFQHVLLLFVVPPLMLWGLPDSLLARVLDAVPESSFIRKAVGPVPALVLYAALMWVWHLPSLYEAALGNEVIHLCEHLCFLGSATLFWWLIVRPDLSLAPIPALARIALLFGAAISSTGLAALLTFATTVLYPTYALGPPYSAVRDALGMTPLIDQQIGGLLMWIGGGSWYLGAVAIVFFRWFEGTSEDDSASLDHAPARSNGVMT